MERKGFIVSLASVLHSLGTSKCNNNQSNHYCTHQMPGTVAGTMDEDLPSRSCIGMTHARNE